MTDTRIDYELPFKSVNGEGLRAGVAGQINGIEAADIGLVYGNGHPDAISDQHVIGLVFPVDPANVSQTAVDAVTTDIESLLGVRSTSAAGAVTSPITLINRRTY